MDQFPRIRITETLKDMLYQLSRELKSDDLSGMKGICTDIPGGQLSTCKEANELLNLMTQEGLINGQDTLYLSKALRTVGRKDLGKAVEQWTSKQEQGSRKTARSNSFASESQRDLPEEGEDGALMTAKITLFDAVYQSEKNVAKEKFIKTLRAESICSEKYQKMEDLCKEFKAILVGIGPGCITLFLLFRFLTDLNYFWKCYNKGNLAVSLSRILMDDEMKKTGVKIKVHISEAGYRNAKVFLEKKEAEYPSITESRNKLLYGSDKYPFTAPSTKSPLEPTYRWRGLNLMKSTLVCPWSHQQLVQEMIDRCHQMRTDHCKLQVQLKVKSEMLKKSIEEKSLSKNDIRKKYIIEKKKAHLAKYQKINIVLEEEVRELKEKLGEREEELKQNVTQNQLVKEKYETEIKKLQEQLKEKILSEKDIEKYRIEADHAKYQHETVNINVNININKIEYKIN